MIKLRRVLLAGPDDLAISSAVASISPNLPQTAAEPRPIWEPPAQNPMYDPIRGNALSFKVASSYRHQPRAANLIPSLVHGLVMEGSDSLSVQGHGYGTP
jgi:hypothetical protein